MGLNRRQIKQYYSITWQYDVSQTSRSLWPLPLWVQVVKCPSLEGGREGGKERENTPAHKQIRRMHLRIVK